MRASCAKTSAIAASASFLSLCALGLSAFAGEARLPLADFNSAPACWNAYGNASMEILSSGGKDGGPCVKIELGGISSDNYGSFQIYKINGADKLKDGDFDSLSFWIKGEGEPGAFVVILRERKEAGGGYWVWNGPRWQASAQISTADGTWHKVVCKLKDFVGKEGSQAMKVQNLGGLEFSIGAQLKNPSRREASFQAERIQLEKSVVE